MTEHHIKELKIRATGRRIRQLPIKNNKLT
jgi:hypothetical protein